MIDKMQLVRPKDAARLLGGVSLSTLWRWSKDPSFPKRIRISEKVVGYRRDELEAWVESRRSF